MCSESHNESLADNGAGVHDPAMTPSTIVEPSHIISDDHPFGHCSKRTVAWVLSWLVVLVVPFASWLALNAVASQRERGTNDEHRSTQVERLVEIQTANRDIAGQLTRAMERHVDANHPPAWVIRVLDQHERKFETLGVVLNKIGQDVAATKAAVTSLVQESRQ